MRFTNHLICLSAAAGSAAAVAQAAYPPASNSSVHIMPMNCTAGCETVTEPCTESQTPAPIGTGSYSPPPPPPPTGGPPAPSPTGTWSFPSQPSATPEPAPMPTVSHIPERYEGSATRFSIAGGLIVAAIGALPLLV
ncbi:hypothetical protein Q7P37_003799 [Cladosporium fusiforme]